MPHSPCASGLLKRPCGWFADKRVRPRVRVRAAQHYVLDRDAEFARDRAAQLAGELRQQNAQVETHQRRVIEHDGARDNGSSTPGLPGLSSS